MSQFTYRLLRAEQRGSLGSMDSVRGVLPAAASVVVMLGLEAIAEVDRRNSVVLGVVVLAKRASPASE
jgi:hypothetical protein